MCRRGHIALAAIVSAACLCAPLHAQSSQVGGKVALASQLVDRGVAITPATPVLQGSVSWSSSTGWSLGLAGGVELRSPGDLVVALARVSHFWAFSNDWQAQASLLYYDYGAQGGAYAPDRTAASIYFTYRDVLTFGVSAMRVSDDGDGRLLGAADLDLNWPLAQHVSLTAGAGIAQTTVLRYGHGWDHHTGNRDVRTRVYGYGHLGLAWNDGPWHLQIQRLVTNLDTAQAYGTRAAPRWVATLSRSF